jgi:hypothetical protein
MARLQLSYSNEFRRFVLRDPYARAECASYEMVIERPWSEEYNYRFLIWEEGDWSECITRADLEQHIKDVQDHEGEEVAKIWEQEHTYYVLREDHPVFKLQRKWEAMMELGLFDIPVNHDTWQGKPMSQEALDAMNDARDREMQACAAEMAEALHAAEPVEAEGPTEATRDPDFN